MAKPFSGLGFGGQTITPQAEPAIEGFGGGAAQKKPGFLADATGGQGSSDRYGVAMEMLKSAMDGASKTNSPALAFLTPLIGATLGPRLSRLKNEAATRESTDLIKGLQGGKISDQAQAAIGILGNSAAPDYLKKIAASMLTQGTVPIGQTVARRGGSRANEARPDAPTSRPRLYGNVVEFNGVPGKYDGSGKWWPLLGPDGPATNPANPAVAPVTPSAEPRVSAPIPQPSPIIPADPLSGDLDPLGIRQ